MLVTFSYVSHHLIYSTLILWGSYCNSHVLNGNLGVKYKEKSPESHRLIMSANSMVLKKIFFSFSMTYFE